MHSDTIGHATIYHRDALSVLAGLPDACADAVLVDPPYASGGATLSEKQHKTSEKYQRTGTKKTYPEFHGDNMDQRSWTSFMREWLHESLRLCRDGAPLMCFVDWRQLPALTDAVQWAGWCWRGVHVWDKVCARPNRGRFTQQTEFFLFATKGRCLAASTGCYPGLYSCTMPAARKDHMTQKPVPLLVDMLKVAKAGGLVLDPFMGSASVGEACLRTGRQYIGVELSADYYAISRQRLQAVQQELAHA